MNCVSMCGMLFLIYGSLFFPSVLASVEKSEMGLYEGRRFFVFVCFCNGFDVSGFLHVCCDVSVRLMRS